MISYTDFLDFIFTPISYFANWLSSVANTLINNYFFITILGITIFISLLFLFIDSFHDFIRKKIHDYEDFNNLYDDYCKRQKVKYKYFEEHYIDLSEYNYKLRVMNEQIYNMVCNKNKDLLVDNKIHSLKINNQALEFFKDSNNDDEKIFKKWYDKSTGKQLTPEEVAEFDELLKNF